MQDALYSTSTETTMVARTTAATTERISTAQHAIQKGNSLSRRYVFFILNPFFLNYLMVFMKILHYCVVLKKKEDFSDVHTNNSIH